MTESNVPCDKIQGRMGRRGWAFGGAQPLFMPPGPGGFATMAQRVKECATCCQLSQCQARAMLYHDGSSAKQWALLQTGRSLNGGA